MYFSSQVPPTLKVESFLYKFIEKLMDNKTVTSDENALTALNVVFESDVSAAELVTPADIDEALFSLRSYNFDAFHTFYWSSSEYAGYVKAKTNTSSPTPYSKVSRTAWASINQTLERNAANATSTLSVDDPCKFLKLTRKSGVDRITIDITATASISSDMKGVCLAYLTAKIAQNPSKFCYIVTTCSFTHYFSRL